MQATPDALNTFFFFYLEEIDKDSFQAFFIFNQFCLVLSFFKILVNLRVSCLSWFTKYLS